MLINGAMAIGLMLMIVLAWYSSCVKDIYDIRKDMTNAIVPAWVAADLVCCYIAILIFNVIMKKRAERL